MLTLGDGAPTISLFTYVEGGRGCGKALSAVFLGLVTVIDWRLNRTHAFFCPIVACNAVGQSFWFL